MEPKAKERRKCEEPMSKCSWALSLALSSTVSQGCAHHRVPLIARDAQRDVKRRFAYEFSCDEDAIETTSIMTNRRGYTVTVGAEGCGIRAVYILSPTGAWMLNSDLGL